MAVDTALARRLADVAAAHGVGDEGVRRVRFGQSGRMRQSPAAPWMDFRATQTIAVAECGFDWRARTGPLGLIHVRDALAGGEGRLQVRALGLVPIAGARPSAAITRGELMRYLAELPWCPYAIRQNRALRWRDAGEGRLAVAAGSGATMAEVQLDLDSQGRIVSAFAPDRPRSVGKALIPTPWRGHFLDYRRRDGLWLPERGEVGWIIDGDYACCWEGRIGDWRSEP